MSDKIVDVRLVGAVKWAAICNIVFMGLTVLLFPFMIIGTLVGMK